MGTRKKNKGAAAPATDTSGEHGELLPGEVYEDPPAPWLEDVDGQSDDGADPAPAGAQRDENGDWTHPEIEEGDNLASEELQPVGELEPVPAPVSPDRMHDPDPRLRESAAIVEARYEAMREPLRPEGEAHHMGGPLYWFETRGADDQGFTRGLHTVELPPGPWRGFQAIPLDTEDNLVLSGHVVSHHRGQSAQIHVQGASGWAPVVVLVLVRDERAHEQARREASA